MCDVIPFAQVFYHCILVFVIKTPFFLEMGFIFPTLDVMKLWYDFIPPHRVDGLLEERNALLQMCYFPFEMLNFKATQNMGVLFVIHHVVPHIQEPAKDCESLCELACREVHIVYSNI